MHFSCCPNRLLEMSPSSSCSFIRCAIVHIIWNFCSVSMTKSSYLGKVWWFVSCGVFLLQFITVGFAVTPLYFVWEKILGVHQAKNMLLRASCRVPILLPIWFFAIAFPFFGSINSVVGCLLVTFTVYIIPCLAHMVYFCKASLRAVSNFTPPLNKQSMSMGPPFSCKYQNRDHDCIR